MSEKMIIDALPVRNNILLGIMASDPPPTHNETWQDGEEVYSGETSMKVWAYCADGTQHEAHYEIHDGTGQWFVEGQDDRFNEHGNVTHWMYYPAAPKD